MTIYRDAKPEETDEIVDLINYAFGMQAQKILAKAYAESGATLASRHKVAVDETTGRIIASVGVYPQTMFVGGKRLNAMFLGCVCVHPRRRGEGHMGKLIEMWHDDRRRDQRAIRHVRREHDDRMPVPVQRLRLRDGDRRLPVGRCAPVAA